MKVFEIVIGKSAGDITFGMSRDDARLLLGEYREFENGQVKMNSYDQFPFCMLGYDENNKVDFVCFYISKDIELRLEGKVISDMTSLELFAHIRNLDSTTELEGLAGFVSDSVGIAAYFEKKGAIDISTEEKIEYAKLESITVAVPGYWSKYKK